MGSWFDSTQKKGNAYDALRRVRPGLRHRDQSCLIELMDEYLGLADELEEIGPAPSEEPAGALSIVAESAQVSTFEVEPRIALTKSPRAPGHVRAA